jgi:nucleotide-binding universal stress UspA family protein
MKPENKELEPTKIVDSNTSSPSYNFSADSQHVAAGSSDKLPKRIVVPLDGSEFSFRAAKYAINLAGLTGGELLCVHAVVDLPYMEYLGPGSMNMTHYLDNAKENAEQWFSQVRAIASTTEEDIKVRGETIFNLTSVAESILSYASEQEADLIVIGTKGRAGLKRIVLGSVASSVVAHASCPVLVVR